MTDAPETEVSQAAPEAPEEAEKDAGKAEKPKKSVGREIREWVVALAAAVLIAPAHPHFPVHAHPRGRPFHG